MYSRCGQTRKGENNFGRGRHRPNNTDRAQNINNTAIVNLY